MDNNNNNNNNNAPPQEDHDPLQQRQHEHAIGVGVGIGIGDIGDIGAGIGGAGFGQLGDNVGAGIEMGGAGLLLGLGAPAAGGMGAGLLGLGGPPPPPPPPPPVGVGGIGAGLAGLGAFGQPQQNAVGLGEGVGQGFLTSHVQQRMPSNPARTALRLSADERSCALEIEQAVAASGKRKANDDDDSALPLPLTPLTALQYAQHALVAQGTGAGTAPVFHALQRMHGMQEVCQHYDIDDTVTQGLESIEALMEQQPGYVLEVECDPNTHQATLVLDRKAFYPSKALSSNNNNNNQKRSNTETTTSIQGLDQNWRVLVRGLYYLHRACQPNLAAVRHGLTVILDCEGMDLEQNVNEHLDAQLYAELEAHWPTKYQTIRAYNTATAANVWLGLCKRFHTTTEAPRIERRVVERATTNDSTYWGALEVGCQAVDVDASRAPRRISETYLPTKGGAGSDARALEVLQTKVLTRVRQLLEQRDRHEANFTLVTTEDTSSRQEVPALPFGMAAAPQW